MRNRIFFVVLFFTFLSIGKLYNNILFMAMDDEIRRSITRLQIEKQKKPYYISYRIEEREYIKIKASFGGLLYSNRNRIRDLYVDLRIGDYSFDNSNFVARISHSRIIGSDYTSLPLDDNYDALRNDLWLITDGTYKKALEELSRKKATIQNQQVKDQTSDFSKVTSNTAMEPAVKLAIDEAVWENTIVTLSRIFQKYPDIQESSITFYSRAGNQYFLDTEGSKSQQGALLTYIEVTAKAQSKDGNPIEDILGFYCHAPDELPDIATISRKVEAMAETLTLQIVLEETEDYSGPVLFVGQAAAEFMFQILGKGVSDPRKPLFENETVSGSAGRDMGVLANRIGRRVISSFLHAYDDPTLKKWNGKPLVGYFAVDDQGVPAKKAEIIKDGKLCGVLMSRTPTKKIDISNGHGRFKDERFGSRVCGMVGNLIIEADETKSHSEMKEMLIDICRNYEIPYGIIVTRLEITRPRTLRERYMGYFTSMTSGSEKPILSSPVVAYKIDVETKTVELIRGLTFSSVTPRVLRDIVASGNEDFVYNFVFWDEEGNAYPMSVITPSILVEEMDIETSGKKARKLPILNHPYFKN